MGPLSRSQLLVYSAVAVALILVGARWIRSADSGVTRSGGVSYSTGGGSSSSSGAGSFAVDSQGGEDVVVDVAGEVSRPGVYRLPAGSRVNDAVQRAGGATAKANVAGINLAARLTDGQQIFMPATAEGPGGMGTGSELDRGDRRLDRAGVACGCDRRVGRRNLAARRHRRRSLQGSGRRTGDRS